ncbi:hypothetical protein DFH07DRAFT_738527, partial [Mycena maculata]
LNVIETYPALIGCNQQVFEFFREQTHLCVFDLNLSYPQNSHFMTLNLVRPTAKLALRESLLNPTEHHARTLCESIAARYIEVHVEDALFK